MQPLSGIRVLDLGCGAGLVTEVCVNNIRLLTTLQCLARLGAKVVGVDAAAENVLVRVCGKLRMISYATGCS